MKKNIFFGFFLLLSFQILAQKKDEIKVEYRFERKPIIALEGVTYATKTETVRAINGCLNYKCQKLEIGKFKELKEGHLSFRDANVEYEKEYLTLSGFKKNIENPDFTVKVLISHLVSETKDTKHIERGFYQTSYIFKIGAWLKIYNSKGDTLLNSVIASYDDTQKQTIFPDVNFHYVAPSGVEYSLLQQDIARQIYSHAQNILHEKIAKKTVIAEFELTSFSSKEHSYEDLQKAQTFLKDALTTEKSGLDGAIEIYEKALTEYQDNKKARINNKVKESVIFNLALAYAVKGDFEKALSILKDFEPKLAERAFTVSDDKSGKMKSSIIQFSFNNHKVNSGDLASTADEVRIKVKDIKHLYDFLLEENYRNVNKK